MFPTNSAWRIGKFRLTVESMEEELRNSLQVCVAAYAAAKQCSAATVGRLAAGDWRFFDRLNDPAKTFTARKFDEVIGWFSRNWPPETPWPDGIQRPTIDDVQDPAA